MTYKNTYLFLFSTFLFLCPVKSYSQSYKYIIGTETSGTILSAKNPITEEKLKYTGLRFGPHVGYFIAKNKVIGITGEYEFVKSNYTSHPSLYGAGIYFRYYLPIQLKRKFWKKHFMFFGEGAFSRVNYIPFKEEIKTTNNLSQNLIRINAGFNFKVYKQLNLEWSIRPEFYLDEKSRITYRFGIEYLFLNKKENE